MRALPPVLLLFSAAALLLFPATALATSGGDAQARGLVQKAAATELANLASEGDALRLWQRATASAADAVVATLREQDTQHTVELKGSDLEELQIWHGQSVSLGVEVDGQRYRFMVQSEQEWQRLANVLGSTQGGLLPGHDWESLDRHWLAPVARGSLLPDFALEGPLDVYLTQPTALQLYLPHASDAGVVRRVLLREGAAVMVRGARSVRLRRGLDLPPISLSEFAGIVTADAAQQQPLGVLHLLGGVHSAAQAHWNASHPDQTLGLVALELELSPAGAALLAAPAPASQGGGSRRLRARRVATGAIELVPRDGGPASQGATLEGPSPAAAAASRGAVALQREAGSQAGAAAAPEGPWPLKSVHPSQLQAYEKLLRQVITSRLFQPAGRGKGGSGGSSGAAGQQLRVAGDVQLRLVETEAEATTLLQLQLELERRPKRLAGARAAAAGGGKDGGEEARSAALVPAAGDEGAAGGAAEAAGPGSAGKRSRLTAAEYLSSLEDPPDLMQVLSGEQRRGQLGPFETWAATVQIRGDAQRGTLQFVPLILQRLDAAADSVQFAPSALTAMLGLGNATAAQVVLE